MTNKATQNILLAIASILFAGFLWSLQFLGSGGTSIFTDCYKEVSPTTLSVKNSHPLDTVTVYLTLSGGEHRMSDVYALYGIKTSGLQGQFQLLPQQELSYTPPNGTALIGNFTFGEPPINCPKGNTRYEFTLNNSFQGINAQETVDISCVAGVNAIGEFTLKGGGPWTATTGYTNIQSIFNRHLYENRGQVGVFPYGCDDCTSSKNPPKCVKQHAPAQLKPICNVSRNATTQRGGTVTCEFITLVK